MTDNINVTPGTGATIAAENVGGILIQRVKLALGVLDSDDGDVSATQPLPANITKIGGSALSLGQQLAASSVPVVLTAAQLTSLTAPVLAAGTALVGATSTQPLISATGSTTRPATTGTTTIGWLLANSATAGSVTPIALTVARGNDIPGEIVGLELYNSDTTLTGAVFRVWILGGYSSFGGVSNGDKGALAFTTATDVLGYFDVVMTRAEASQSVGFGTPMNGQASIPFKPVTGTSRVDCLIEVRTGSYALVSGQTFTVRAKTR